MGTLKPASGKRLSDTLEGLDTPTLKGIWATAPYLHDGSAATLMDVIGRNTGDRHGGTSRLTKEEKEDLVEYLLQIDGDADPALTTRPSIVHDAEYRERQLGEPGGGLIGWNGPAPVPGLYFMKFHKDRGRWIRAFQSGLSTRPDFPDRKCLTFPLGLPSP